MRKENRPKVTTEGLKRKGRKRAVTVRQTCSRKRKDSQTEERSPVVLSNTRQFRSFQMAQKRAWRPKTQIFREDMHGDNDLQLKMRSTALAEEHRIC